MACDDRAGGRALHAMAATETLAEGITSLVLASKRAVRRAATFAAGEGPAREREPLPGSRPSHARFAQVSDARGLSADASALAWAERAGERWRLVVRTRHGELQRPRVPTFVVAPEAELGTLRGGRQVLTYARCVGRSATRGCDARVVDLAGGRERAVEGLSSSSVSETSPDVFGGRWAYVARGGPRPGLTVREPDDTVRRLSSRTPSDVSLRGMTVAAIDRQNVLLVDTAVPGRVRRIRSAPGPRPQSVSMSNYRALWREGNRLVASTRVDVGSPVTALQGRVIPGLRAIAVGSRSTPLLLTRSAVLRAGSSGYGR